MKNYLRDLLLLCALSVATAAQAFDSETPGWGFYFATAYGHQDSLVLSLVLKSAHFTLDKLEEFNSNGKAKPHHGESFYGHQERPTSLDIQWENIKSSERFSEHVDLDKVLPASIENTEITLVFNADKLYVYLAYLDIPAPSDQNFPKWMIFNDKKIIQIFPAAGVSTPNF